MDVSLNKANQEPMQNHLVLKFGFNHLKKPIEKHPKVIPRSKLEGHYG